MRIAIKNRNTTNRINTLQIGIAVKTKRAALVAVSTMILLAVSACGGGGSDDPQNHILEGSFSEGDPTIIAIPMAIHTVNMLNNEFRVGNSKVVCVASGCTGSGSTISDTLTIEFTGYTSGYSTFTGTVVVNNAGDNPVLSSSNLKITVYRQFAQSDHDITLSGISLNPAGEILDGIATLGGIVQSPTKLESDQGVFFSYSALAGSYALINNISRICGSGDVCASKDRLHAIAGHIKGNTTTLSQTRTYNMTSITTYINKTFGNFHLSHSENMENLTQNKLKENLANNDVYLKYNIYSTKGTAQLASSSSTFTDVRFIRRQSQYQRNESLIRLKGRALYKENFITFVESSSSCRALTKAFHITKVDEVPANIAKRYEEYGEVVYLQTDLSGDGNSNVILILKKEPLDKCDSGAPIFQIVGPVDGLIGGSAQVSNPKVNNGVPWALDELFLNVYYDPYITRNTAAITSYYYQ